MKAKFIRGRDPKHALGVGLAKEADEIYQSTGREYKDGGSYSFNYYGADNWMDIIHWLLSLGYNSAEVEAVLRSKLMRWAAGHVRKTESGMSTLEDFQNFNTRLYSGQTEVDAFLDDFFPDPTRKARVKHLNEEAVGGVSAPMATAHNTPGMGSAQPAATASTGETSGNSTTGSGDLWDDIGKKKKRKKKKVNEDLGYVKYDNDTYEILREEPDRIFIKPLRSPYGGGYHTSPMNTPSFWVSKDSPHLDYPDEGLYEMNINPHDKLGVAMAQKMGVKLPFKKGKGDKDVEQIKVDEDIDLSTELVTFEEWAKKFVNQ
jgi:hypothetical protein